METNADMAMTQEEAFEFTGAHTRHQPDHQRARTQNVEGRWVNVNVVSRPNKVGQVKCRLDNSCLITRHVERVLVPAGFDPEVHVRLAPPREPFIQRGPRRR